MRRTSFPTGSLSLCVVLASAACLKEPPYAELPEPIPPVCGELAEAPDLVLGAWDRGEQPPAGGMTSFALDHETGRLYVGSHNAGAWRSDDDGQSWDWLQTEITHTLADLYVPPGREGVLFRSSGGQLEWSEDGGDSFSKSEVGALDPSKPAQHVLAIGGDGTDGQRIYLVTSDGTAWLSEDGGLSFDEVGFLNAWADPDDMRYLRHMSWRLLGEAEAGQPVVFADDKTVWISRDGLEGWDATLSGAIAGGTLVRNPVEPEELVVGTSLGAVYRSHNGGYSWSAAPVETGRHLHSAAFSPDGQTLYLAAHDTFHVSHDGGDTFSEVDAPFDLPMALMVDADGRVLMGDNQGVERSTDEGASWEPSDEGMEDVGVSVVVPHPTCPDRVTLGSRCSGGLFTSADWGSSWAHTDGNFHYVMGVHHDPQDPERVWAVSDDALYESTDGGGSWELRFVSYHYHGMAIDPEDGDSLLIGSVGSGEYADEAGRIYHSSDGGRSWEDASAGIPESEASMHTLLHWPGKPDVVLLGTYKGGDVSHQSGEGIGLFRSEDRGMSWEKADLPLDNIAWLTEWGADGVAAATEDGLWVSSDEGRTWTRQEGPEGWLLGADFDGELGFTMAQQGGLWRTEDGGRTWTEDTLDTWWDPTTWLGAVAITPSYEDSDARMVYLTIYNNGLWRMRLE